MKEALALNAGERLDDLIIGGYKIIQHEDEFCFAIDAVLLGHFATIKTYCVAVDLGAGTGVLGFILLHRGVSNVAGIELNSSMVQLSRRSIEYNGENARYSIVEGDYRSVRDMLAAECANLVISNPPYRNPQAGFVSPKRGIAMAKHELTADFRAAIDAAAYLLPTGGAFALSHLPERLPEIMAYAQARGLTPKRLRLVHSAVDKPAIIMLLESVRGARAGLTVLPPLIIYRENGIYSEEVLGYYKQ